MEEQCKFSLLHPQQKLWLLQQLDEDLLWECPEAHQDVEEETDEGKFLIKPDSNIYSAQILLMLDQIRLVL